MTYHKEDQLMEKESKYYHQNKYFEYYQYYLHNYKSVIHLRIYQTRFIKFSIQCIEQKTSVKKNLKTSVQRFNLMNSENRNHKGKRLPNLTYKMGLRKGGKHVALSDISIYYIMKNIKKSCKSSNLRISGANCDEEF